MTQKKEEMELTMPLITQGEQSLTDARWLHQRLQSGYQFSDWIKTRINEFGFIEGQDYFIDKSKKTLISEISEIVGKRKTTNYLITLDMAKELAMLERNDIGRNMRRYFIEVEKKARGMVQTALPPVNHAFKGLPKEKINGRKLVGYKAFLINAGMNAKSGSVSDRIVRYPQHFVKMGNLTFVTEEFAMHLYHQRAVYNNRQVMKNSQPVLALDFGQTDMFEKGGTSHAN